MNIYPKHFQSCGDFDLPRTSPTILHQNVLELLQTDRHMTDFMSIPYPQLYLLKEKRDTGYMLLFCLNKYCGLTLKIK